MVEIGNYDGFYSEGRVFSAEEVLRLTQETRRLIGDRVPLSVTVPHTLALAEQVTTKPSPLLSARNSITDFLFQVALAMELEAAGADIIQTEGGRTHSFLRGFSCL
jgi:hypothetical protein